MGVGCHGRKILSEKVLKALRHLLVIRRGSTNDETTKMITHFNILSNHILVINVDYLNVFISMSVKY